MSLLVSIIAGGCAHMKTEQLFNQGRYGEAYRVLKERIPDPVRVPTNQLVWLCHAEYKLKKYADLFNCLDQLESKIQRGDRYLEGDINSFLGTMRSFPYDLTVIPYLLRAEALIETGRYEEATIQARKAYETAVSMKWPLADLQINWERICRIRALGLLAISHAFNGNRQEAQRYTEKLEIESTGLSARYFVDKEKTFALGRAYMAQGRYDKVLEFQTDFLLAFAHVFTFGILKAVEGTNFAYVELPKEFVKYKSLFETGRIEEARGGYDRLLARPQTKDNGELYWAILFDRGKIDEREGDSKKAIERYKQAVEVIESQRSTINSEASKIGFVGDKQGVYHRLVDLLYGEKDYVSAFAYAERAKARALVDLLATASLSTPQDPLAKDSLVTELADLERQEKAVEIAMTGRERKTRSIQLRETIKARDPELASLISVDPPLPGEIQARLGMDETLVEYFLQEDDLFVFVMTAHDLRGRKIKAKGLESLVRKYRNELQETGQSGYLKTSAELYNTLIAPVAPFLKTEKVIVVPHGILHYLPFGSLRAADGYVAEKHSLALLPSAGILPYLKARQKVVSSDILIVANPDLGDATYALKFAEKEADDIAPLFPRAQKIIRERATKSAFKDLAGRFGYIHIAAHGMFRAEDPLNSGIMLARQGSDDGLLRMGDLYGMRLKADLVTLSACETALGKVSAGDDVIGLTRGFLYAGVDSIVASLWPVDDEATALFMKAFYTSLKTKGKADALRNAQRTVMKQYPHPYFWAPFQLTGLPE
ncbi:MAG: CHAT domain-containing protein [Syntrophales bacterium]